MGMTFQELTGSLKSKFSGIEIPEPSPVKGYPTIKLSSKEDLLPLMTLLKEEFGFDYLDFITAIDWKSAVDLRGYIMDPNPNPFLPEGATPEILPEKPPAGFPFRDSFELVYGVTNLKECLKVFIRLEIPRQTPTASSLMGIWQTADWQEREVFDLMGVTFDGHPNLKKILTPDFIQGYPLRKDYVHTKDQYD